jgi:hypothetical protein
MRLDGPSGVVAPPLVSGCETSLRVRLGIRSVWTIVWGGDEAAVIVAASVEVSCSPSNWVDRLFDLSRLTWLTVNRLTAGDSVPVNADADLFSRYLSAKSTEREPTADASFKGTDLSLPKSSSSSGISSPEKLRLISPGVCHLVEDILVLFPSSRVPLRVISVLERPRDLDLDP